VAVEDGQQLVVFDVSKPSAEMGFAEETEMREQLPKPDIGR
jgi:hypothetical protein